MLTQREYDERIRKAAADAGVTIPPHERPIALRMARKQYVLVPKVTEPGYRAVVITV